MDPVQDQFCSCATRCNQRQLHIHLLARRNSMVQVRGWWSISALNFLPKSNGHIPLIYIGSSTYNVCLWSNVLNIPPLFKKTTFFGCLYFLWMFTPGGLQSASWSLQTCRQYLQGTLLAHYLLKILVRSNMHTCATERTTTVSWINDDSPYLISVYGCNLYCPCWLSELRFGHVGAWEAALVIPSSPQNAQSGTLDPRLIFGWFKRIFYLPDCCLTILCLQS